MHAWNLSKAFTKALFIISIFAASTLPAEAKQLLPDLQGYTLTDSNEPGGPVFNYVDISISGTATGLWDGEQIAIPIGFSFNFHGTNYSHVTVGDNGYLIFNGSMDPLPVWNEGSNAAASPIPQPIDPYGGSDWVKSGPFVAPMYTDLDPIGGIYWKLTGTAPNRRLIIQYQVAHWWSWNYDMLDFEVVLFEGSNEIAFQYLDVEDTDPLTLIVDPAYSYGKPATIGAQFSNTEGFNYSNDTPSLTNGMAILISPPTGPFVGMNHSQAVGAPGSVVTHTITVNNQTGADTDFTVSVQQGSNWTVSAPATTGLISNGATATLPINVTIPAAGSLPPLEDLATIVVAGNGLSAVSNLKTVTFPNVQQLTPGTDGFGTPTGLMDAVTSTDGSIVAESHGDWSVTPYTSAELIVSDSAGNRLQSIMTTVASGSTAIAINGTGTKVAFVSRADHVAGQNIDGNAEVFLLDVATGAITQLTQSTGDPYFWPFVSATIRQLQFSPDGSKLGFASAQDMVAGQNPLSRTQLFEVDMATAVISQLTVMQLTNFDGALYLKGYTFDNRPIVWAKANIDVIPYVNVPTGQQLYEGLPGGGFARIISNVLYTDISLDGTKVAFTSRSDPLGANLDAGGELFVKDMSTATLTQLTNFTAWDSLSNVKFTPDGSKLFFMLDSWLEIDAINVDGTGLSSVAYSNDSNFSPGVVYFTPVSSDGRLMISLNGIPAVINGSTISDGTLIVDAAFNVSMLSGHSSDWWLYGYDTAANQLLFGSSGDLAAANPGRVEQLYTLNLSANAAVIDSDGDGIPDALEPLSANSASTVVGLPLTSGGTVDIYTLGGEALASVSTAPLANPPAGIAFPFGTIAYHAATNIGGTVVTSLTFSTPLPANLLLYKVDSLGVLTALPASVWTQTGPNSVEITLTDGGPFDLDGVANGHVVDPLAVADGVVPQITTLTNLASFRAGDTQMLTASINPNNSARVMDVWVTLTLPNQSKHYLRLNGSLSSSPVALATNWQVANATRNLFTHLFNGIEPLGTYTWEAGLYDAGTMNLISPAAITTFTVTP